MEYSSDTGPRDWDQLSDSEQSDLQSDGSQNELHGGLEQLQELVSLLTELTKQLNGLVLEERALSQSGTNQDMQDVTQRSMITIQPSQSSPQEPSTPKTSSISAKTLPQIASTSGKETSRTSGASNSVGKSRIHPLFLSGSTSQSSSQKPQRQS